MWSGARFTVAAASCLFVASCGRAYPEGTLMPVTGPGVEIVTGARTNDYARPGDTARLRSGQATAEITGRWAETGSQDLTVRVVNGGSQPVRLPSSAYALTLADERAELWMIFDVTGVSLADERTDNDQAVTLYDAETKVAARPDLIISGRSRREYRIMFANFKRRDNRVDKGDALTVEAPMPGRPAARIRFVAD